MLTKPIYKFTFSNFPFVLYQPYTNYIPKSMERYVKLMQPFLAKEGYLTKKAGAQQVRIAYRNGSTHFHPDMLSEFGMAVFIGYLEGVRQMIEAGSAPPLNNTETPYKFPYVTLLIMGAQRVAPGQTPQSLQHYATLEYLISKGIPLDIGDIVGLTPLHHAIQHPSQNANDNYVRLLLNSGATVDKKDRYGITPLLFSLPTGNAENVEMLLAAGADLDAADADGATPKTCYLNYGPQVTAVVQKWIRKRNGKEEAPRTEKACGGCGEKEKPLKNCSKCQVERYCSRECQKAHWPTHKKTCKPFNAATTVTLKPVYDGAIRSLVPMQQFAQSYVGYTPTERPASHSVASAVPKNLSAPKSVTIKVQVPMGGGNGDMMVYTKKRDFVCTIRRRDAPEAYDAVAGMVRSKGVSGLKAYFAAELRSPDELVVKVAEVLAEQPF